jgi:hypothetical protein
MKTIAFEDLYRNDQQLLEALERGGRGERRRLAARSALELNFPVGVFAQSLAPRASDEVLAFRTTDRRSRVALLRIRRGSQGLWFQVHHHHGDVERVAWVKQIPSFMAVADDDSKDGQSDHAHSASVRTVQSLAAQPLAV